MVETPGKIHESGYNCAQSVLYSLNDLTGLGRKKSLALAGGFGGGMRAAEVCGAVSGAVMALGLIFPFSDAKDMAAKDRIAEVTREFHKRFRAKNKCIICRELLRYDVETKEGMTKVKELDLINKYCPAFMDDAAGIVREIASEYKIK